MDPSLQITEAITSLESIIGSIIVFAISLVLVWAGIGYLRRGASPSYSSMSDNDLNQLMWDNEDNADEDSDEYKEFFK